MKKGGEVGMNKVSLKVEVQSKASEYSLQYCIGKYLEEAGFDNVVVEPLKVQEPSKYEYHTDHTDCPWYISGEESRCPVTCSQYRDGWNDAMNYIFRNGDGYRPYDRTRKGR